jgi:hypothetical protein
MTLPLQMNNQFNFNRKYIGIAVIILIIILVLFGASRFFSGNSSQSNGQSNVEQIEVAPAKAKMDLNKEFSFPLLDAKGAEISKLKYIVENAELQDEIIVKGQKATSIKGKTFLIVNLKIINDYNQAITINTRDYVRLVVNSNEQELLAPEIHNDPVEVLAISTKYTRVGFTVNEVDKDLKLKVGEIKGEKSDLPLTFSN